MQVEISPRLMPGIRIGEVWVQVSPTDDADRQGKPRWDYAVDGEWDDKVGEGTDLWGWGNAQEMLATLLCFLSAQAEAIDFTERTGMESENAELFPAVIGEWAQQNSDEITMAEMELRGEDE